MNNIEIIEIKENDLSLQKVITNLTKMYCCEWSTYNFLDVNEEGIYPFEKYLPSFWTSTDKHAFLLKYNGFWSGMALIDKDFNIHHDYDYALSEFFILPKYRKAGLGTYLVKSLFDLFPGSWEIGRNPKNITSVAFWDKVINDYTKGKYEVIYKSIHHKYADGTLGDVLSFKKEEIYDTFRNSK